MMEGWGAEGGRELTLWAFGVGAVERRRRVDDFARHCDGFGMYGMGSGG